uniref:Docking protein 2-like n=1 Tax=Callorhinchus milii TaxID=7868 RepID=A0A4W3HKS2_CALMI
HSSTSHRCCDGGIGGQVGGLCVAAPIDMSPCSFAVKEFRVTIHKTVAAERCQLWGTFNLNAEKEGLELRDVKSGEILYTWPYRFLRRFGRDKVTFSFEAGRRCVSGEGSFEFDTRHGNAIFQVIESAIKHPPTASATLKPQSVGPRLGLPQPPKAESTYSQVRAPSNKNPQPQASEANSEYAVPFDAIARSSPTGPAPSDPLYDSIDESLLHPRPKARPTKDPIYDEPEGVADSCLYDMPEEMKGHAWKLQGLAGDPGGHEVPYNPQTDDYAVPKEAGAKHGPSKQGSRERLRDNASSQCEYDNIMFKFQDKKGNQLV